MAPAKRRKGRRPRRCATILSPRAGRGRVRGPLGRARHCGKVCTASIQPRRSESRRGPLTLVRSARSTSPRTRGEVKCAPSFSQRDPRRSFIHGEVRIGKVRLRSSTTRHLLFPSFTKEERRQNADRRRSNRRACTRRALSGARTPVGVPPRLSPKGIIPSQRLGFRPGFLGRGLNGRYPPSPVPVQGAPPTPVVMPGG